MFKFRGIFAWLFPMHLYQTNVAAAVVGSAVVGMAGSSMAASAQQDAADTAAGAQTAASQAQIGESRRQFDEVRQLLAPYTNSGPAALTSQWNLLGLNGQGLQQDAISGIANGAQYKSMVSQGENAILQNASATGGLRGGNTQAALAQFRPQLLNQLIDQQYQRLGGLTTMGQNSAAGVGAAGQNSSNQIIAALGQQGAAQAGSALAQGRADASMYNGLSGAAGQAFGMFGGNGFGGSAAPSNVALPSTYTGGSSFGGESFGNMGWGAF